MHRKYIDTLKKEIRDCNIEFWDLQSIYFWWGSPSLVDPALIGEVVNFVIEWQNGYFKIGNHASLHGLLRHPPRRIPRNDTIAYDVEILMEANPEDIDRQKLIAWKNAWINKLSIWVQTFQKKFWKFLDREIFEQADDLIKKINLARYVFDDVSIDMIFWFPGQSRDDVLRDLEIIKGLDLSHVSWYGLDYKKWSKIEKLKERDDDLGDVCRFYDVVCDGLKDLGFEQYEIYNFSKKDRKHIHNLDFWKMQDYLWFGLSAVWMIWSTVYENKSDLKKYLQWEIFISEQMFDKDELALMLLQRGFRLNEGVDIAILKKICSAEMIKNIERSKFITKKWNIYALTRDGMMRFNEFFDDIY